MDILDRNGDPVWHFAYPDEERESDIRLMADTVVMLELLRKLEWAVVVKGGNVCFCCGRFRFEGHRPGCRLAELLTKHAP